MDNYCDILIAADGQLSLEDSDNMRAFSSVEEVGGAVATRLAATATPSEEQHYWLDANAVVELSGRKHDRQWLQGFRDMLAQVEAFGSSDMQNKRIKSHVEQA